MLKKITSCKSNYIIVSALLIVVSFFVGMRTGAVKSKIKNFRLDLHAANLELNNKNAEIDNLKLRQKESIEFSKDSLRNYFVPDDYGIRLYQLMKDVHELFEKHGIKYSANSGTLLGAVRHGGIIPWDDDLDIVIFPEDVDKFFSLKTEFEKLGYNFGDSSKETIDKYKDYTSWVQIGYNDDLKDPIVDVFLLKKIPTFYGHNIYMNGSWATVMSDTRDVFFENDLLPLKKYKFGPIEIWGPNSPYYNLGSMYENWDRIAWTSNYGNHLNPYLERLGKEKYKPLGKKIILNGDLYLPLYISKPLENRVK